MTQKNRTKINNESKFDFFIRQKTQFRFKSNTKTNNTSKSKFFLNKTLISNRVNILIKKIHF